MRVVFLRERVLAQILLASAAGSCARTEISMHSTQTKDKATKSRDTFTSEKMDAIIDLW